MKSSEKNKRTSPKKKVAVSKVKATRPSSKQMQKMMDKMFRDWKNSK